MDKNLILKLLKTEIVCHPWACRRAACRKAIFNDHGQAHHDVNYSYPNITPSFKAYFETTNFLILATLKTCCIRIAATTIISTLKSAMPRSRLLCSLLEVI